MAVSITKHCHKLRDEVIYSSTMLPDTKKVELLDP